MRDTGMVHHFSIPPARLIRWTRAVRSSYQDNPFHNWYHGFSVFHFSYYQLYISDISTFLHPLDIFGLLVAAICHDSDHPGLTNKHLTDTEVCLKFFWIIFFCEFFWIIFIILPSSPRV